MLRQIACVSAFTCKTSVAILATSIVRIDSSEVQPRFLSFSYQRISASRKCKNVKHAHALLRSGRDRKAGSRK